MILKLRGLTLLVCMLLTCAVFWQAGKRGGLVNALHLPPALDRSTPTTQNGFVMLEMQQPKDDNGNFEFSHDGEMLSAMGEEDCAAGIWVKLPFGVIADDCRMTGRASSGETFPLKPLHVVSASDEILFVSLPGGYPGTIDFMDVSVADRANHTAHWRITRLPVMRRAIPAAAAVQDTFQNDGLRLALRAFRVPYKDRAGDYIRYQVFPHVTSGTHQWELTYGGDGSAHTDWVPYLQGAPTSYGFMDLDSPDARSLMRSWHGAVIDNFILNPFVRDDHFVRMTGRVQQFETYDEQVTFHNVGVSRDFGASIFTVTQAQSLTTPSGITVTLPVQSRATFMHGDTLIEPHLLLNVLPHAAQNILPRSPLARSNAKPVSVSIDFPKPFGKVMFSIRPNGHNQYDVFVPPGQPSVLKDFPVIVRQRVELQSYPLNLTTPIADAPPPSSTL